MTSPESITVSMPSFELWYPVAGYEGLYKVSNLGRVWRQYKHGGERELKAFWLGRYLCAELSRDNRQRMFPISRLVAVAFLPNHENKPQVNHRNGNRGQNWVTNLEWATAAENTQHAVDTGLRPRVIGVALQTQNGRPPWNKGKKTGQIPWNKGKGYLAEQKLLPLT